jgi:hypothetical protein
MTKQDYSVVMLLFFCFAVAFQRGRNPFGNDFIAVFVPSLLFLNSLHWLILPKKVIWKIVGLCSSFLIFSFLYLSYTRSRSEGLANFATFLFLFIVAQTLTFWILTSDSQLRKISVATNLGTLFLVFFGVFLNARGIESLGFSGGRFLLLSPLGAMFLFVGSVAYRWHYVTQIVFVCTLIQIGMGLFDVGDASNIRWMSACSAIVVFAALGFAAYWVKDWNT